MARPEPGARFARFTSYGGHYTTAVPLAALDHPHALVALAAEGEELPVEYGGPARALFPQLWGYKSAKSIIAIDFLDHDEDGYWESAGVPGRRGHSRHEAVRHQHPRHPSPRRRRGGMVGNLKMEHSCDVVVRWYECDTYGHVNNAVYLHYLEFARENYMRDLGISFSDMRASGIGLVVARVSIDYRRPAMPEDRLTIITRPLKRTRIGGVLGQRVLRRKSRAGPGRGDAGGGGRGDLGQRERAGQARASSRRF